MKHDYAESRAGSIRKADLWDSNGQRESFKSHGFDSIKSKQTSRYGDIAHNTVGVFDQDQIKSAVGNSGQFGDTGMVNEETQQNSHHISMGRIALVDRIRGGQLQIRHVVSEQQGFKIVDGNLVKMMPQEIRRRHRGARIAARKRRAQSARVVRNQQLSMRKREMRLGV